MIHQQCSGVRGDLSLLVDNFRCKRCDGTIREAYLAEDLVVDGETYGCVKSFCFLGDTLDGDCGVYASCVRSSMTYGSETRPLLFDVWLMFERAEMQMIRWMCGVSMKDRMTNEDLRRLVGVQPITTVIRSGRLRWYGHVMRKGDEHWVKKCMELKTEDRLEDQERHG